MELLKIDWLDQIAVGMIVVRFGLVGLGCGRGQDHDRDGSQLLVRLELGEHFMSVNLRELEVQKNDIGLGAVCIVSFASQIRERLRPVVDAIHPVGDLIVGQRHLHQLGVGVVVFHQEKTDGLSRHVDPLYE